MQRIPIPLKTLVLSGIASSVLASAFWLLDLFPISQVGDRAMGVVAFVRDNWVRLTVLSIPLFGGLLPSLWLERRLKQGLTHKLWRETDVEAVKTLLAQRWWTWALAAYAVLALAIPPLSRHHFMAGSIAIALLPTQVFLRVRMLVSPTARSRTHDTPTDWEQFKPVHSDHWGEPPHVPNA